MGDVDAREQRQVEKTSGGADLGQGGYYGEFSFGHVKFWIWKVRYKCKFEVENPSSPLKPFSIISTK